MKYLKALTYSLLALFLLDYCLTLEPDAVQCDGDLIAFEKVENDIDSYIANLTKV